MDGPLIVGFGHRRRVGKDTVADLVRDRLRAAGVNVFRDAFAWNIKQATRLMFRYAGLADDSAYERWPKLREVALPDIGLSPRDLWIAVGNKIREVAPDVWIRGVLDNPAYVSGSVLIISDLRYPAEVKAIRDRGGAVIKVVRPGTPESTDVADSALAGMKTGAWDRVVLNDGDLDALDRKAGFLAEWITRRLATRNSTAE